MKSKVVFCPLFDSFPPVRGLRAFNRNNPIGRAARQMFNFNDDTAAADHVIIANISISAEIFIWICVFVFLYLLGGNFDAMKLVWFVFVELYLCVRNCRFVLVYLCLYVCFFVFASSVVFVYLSEDKCLTSITTHAMTSSLQTNVEMQHFKLMIRPAHTSMWL